MTNLVPRESLFQNLFDFRREFDQIFNRMMTGWPSIEEQSISSPAVFAPTVESFVDKAGKMYHCRLALAGVDPKDVQISAQGNVLTVTGERKATHESSEAEFHHREMWYGTFERKISLPEGVEADKLTAEYHNGVLEISAPVSASVLPRRIEIKSGETPTAKQMAA